MANAPFYDVTDLEIQLNGGGKQKDQWRKLACG